MNVTRLVQGALSLAGIRSQGLNQPTAAQTSDSLFWLNQILSEQSITSDVIPYITEFTFPMVVGQEKYSIPNLAQADTVTYLNQGVRYGIIEQSLDQYKASYRVQPLNSLPYIYYQQRTNAGSDLYFYFFPSQDFTCIVNGKFQFPVVDNMTDLDTFIAPFYQTYLMYVLARQMCDWYTLSVSQQLMLRLAMLQKQLKSMNSFDMNYQPTRMLSSKTFFNWPIINLAQGWMPV